jgi:alpha-glucosidase
MQWTRDGGFTWVTPWLPYSNLDRNVADETKDPASLLTLYRRLIWFRRSSDALRFGDYRPIDGTPPGVFAHTRSAGSDRVLVALNFTNDAIEFDLPHGLRPVETLIGTHGEPSASQPLALAPNEARLLRIGA